MPCLNVTWFPLYVLCVPIVCSEWEFVIQSSEERFVCQSEYVSDREIITEMVIVPDIARRRA